MPDIQHASLGSADVHEPKHITLATTADAGKVITPSSTTNGISTLRKLNSTDIVDNNFSQAFAYGGKTVKNNATVFAIPAAVDTTFNTASDFTQVTGIFENPDVHVASGVTLQTNTVTVPYTGIYIIHHWAVVSSNNATTDIAFNLGVNGAVSTDRPTITRVIGANDRMLSAAHAYVALTAGAVLSLHVASSTTSNIRIHQARFSVELVRRTA